MHVSVVAIGQRIPAWAQAAIDEYARRLPPTWRFEIKALKSEARDGRTPFEVMKAEADRIEAALPSAALRIVLDERGERLTTQALAERIARWQQEGRDVAFVIGGADGLDATIKARAETSLRLSDLTLPHALARVVLVEALYRAASLNAGHPYHRE